MAKPALRRQQAPRVEGLDALRGVAIVAMVVYHFCFDLRYFGVARWDFEHAKGGVLTPDLFVVDTSAELITGSGSVDFRSEQYDLHLKADSKTPSILALKGPVVVGGTFKAPAVRPEMGPLVARIGASVGLGVLAGPLALLPLIDLGDAPDADCKSLYQDARVQSGTTERIARPATPARGKGAVRSAAN